MIIKEPIACGDDSESSPSPSSLWQYVTFTVFILLAIVSVVACAVLYDTRTPETVVIDSPRTANPITIHAYTIQCTHNDEYYCSEYKVYKIIKD
jgi:hypothetical protein